MKKRAAALFLLVITILIAEAAVSLAQQKPIELTKTLIKDVSETIYLDYMPGNVFIANPNVCNFVALREQKKIMLIPTGEGTTSLTIQDTAGQIKHQIKIFVKISDLTRISQELKRLIGDIEGVEIKIIGKKVLIDGEILLPKDLNRIVTVAEQYDPKKEVGIIATLSPLAQKIIAQKMEEDIHQMGESFKEIRVRAVNQRFLLEGAVDWAGEKEGGDLNRKIAVETAKTYVPDKFFTAAEKAGQITPPGGGPPIVVDLLVTKKKPAAELAKMIHITANYVELSKTYAKNFAFNWTPGIQDRTTATLEKGKLLTTVTATVSSLFPKLNAAKTLGHARVLESTSLIVQENEQGILQNKTKIPITVLQVAGGASQQSTEFEEVGLTLEIKPTVIPNTSHIQLVVNFKLISLIGFNEKGQPSLAQNSINTTLIVKSTESAALGGLVSGTLLTDYNKLPASIRNDQNILFNLYRSKSFQNNKSQFIVFLTPQIVESASEQVQELKRKFRVR